MISGSSATALPAFDPDVTVDSTTTLVTGGAKDWHGRCSTITLASGVVVLNYRSATSHTGNDAQLDQLLSDDYGASWTAANTKLAGGAVSGFPWNPGTGNIGIGEGRMYHLPSGRVVLHGWSMVGTWPTVTFEGVWQSVSDDDCETWSTPAQVAFAGTTDDDMIFSTDQGFVYDGVLYAAARRYVDATGSPSEALLLTADMDGNNWTKRSVIVATNEASSSLGGQETGITLIGGGRILAAIRDNAHTGAWQRISGADLGATWGSISNITSQVGIASRQRVYTKSQLMGLPGWWNDPRLIMVGFTHQVSGDSMPRRNAIWLSRSRGELWTEPIYIDSQSDDGGYGDVFYDPDNDQWVVVNYAGSLTAADVKQYRLTITGW